ncbi:MAG: hypothetical protein ACJ74Q_15675 [Pyrinomonadaceae bacterium]
MFSTMLQHGPFAQAVFMMAAAKSADDNAPRRGKLRSPRAHSRRSSRRRMQESSRRANRGR